jgi:hypothetical protein
VYFQEPRSARLSQVCYWNLFEGFTIAACKFFIRGNSTPHCGCIFKPNQRRNYAASMHESKEM